MFHIVLFEPEIPQNTGNIIRLCANTGTALHLIRPLGFRLDDRNLRRAGLDYHDVAVVTEYDSVTAFAESVCPAHIYPVSTRGATVYSSIGFVPGDAFLFGPESRGLPAELLAGVTPALRIPMKTGSRSLNLSNATTAIVYEAWRQCEFAGDYGQPEQTVARMLR